MTDAAAATGGRKKTPVSSPPAMEDEDQKMMALKKAYAEIILNTSKEAAARVMASERKALRFQQDLFCLKDEALRMLLRLRQMIDFQASEAEVTSVRQRSRIEELEAQLHEAEDIIADLRTELKETKGKLQKMRNKEVCSLNGQLPKVDAPSPENGTCNERLNTTELMSSSPSDSEFGVLPIANIKDTLMHQRVLDNMGSNTTRQTESSSGSPLDNGYADNPDSVPISNIKDTLMHQGVLDNMGSNTTRQTESSSGSPLDNGYADNPDSVPAIIRSKEPELYRDRCTQRIQALESTFLNGKLPHEDVANHYSLIKNEPLIEADEEGEGLHTVPSLNAMNTDSMKNLSKLEDRKQFSRSCNGDQPFKVIWRLQKKRTQYTRSSEPSCFLSRCNTISYSVNSNVKSGEEQLQITENEAKMKPPMRLNPGLTLIKSDMDPISGSVNAVLRVKDVNQSGSPLTAANDDTQLVEEHMLVKEEDDAAGSSRLLSCKQNLEMVDAQSGNSNSNDPNASEATDGTPSQGDNKRLLRYTFQRKRKKESLNNSNENSSPEKSTIKRRVTRQQSRAPEGPKSNLINQSSRDSRRLAQVARQLISLSGKQW